MSLTTFSGPVASQNGFIDSSFTTAERDAIVGPQAGLLIYNTDTNTYEVYTGSGWQEAFAPPAPATTTWGKSSWPSDYTVNSFEISSGTPGPMSFSINTYDPVVEAALLALPVGTVFTVTHGTGITIGDTFTLTGTFSGGAGHFSANAIYAGGGTVPNFANIGQCEAS